MTKSLLIIKAPTQPLLQQAVAIKVDLWGYRRWGKMYLDEDERVWCQTIVLDLTWN